MNEYIAFDSHKHYTLMERENIKTSKARQRRIEHRPGAVRAALRTAEPGTPVAVESIGSWYWIINEIEQAGLEPRLVHPRKAKVMMGCINKTDKLDVHGLNRLQRNGTLPTVWIPPRDVRDLREMTRTRMTLTQQRTRFKNRILATLTKHAFTLQGYSDAFGKKARVVLEKCVDQLPPHARDMTWLLLEQVDHTHKQIATIEGQLKDLVPVTDAMKWLMTLPGVAIVLAAVIAFEVGDITRFPDAQHLASYAGVVPRVHSSGGKTRYGRTRPDVNRYLKWAFCEAANSVKLNHTRCPKRHVSQLYARVKRRRDSSRAVGAVARHLAEAAFHVLSKGEPYCERGYKALTPQGGRTRKA
jgi:transposase